MRGDDQRYQIDLMCARKHVLYREMVFVFFFQAEDGIRDYKVTGVQTCALPISSCAASVAPPVKAGIQNTDIATQRAGPSFMGSPNLSLIGWDGNSGEHPFPLS